MTSLTKQCPRCNNLVGAGATRCGKCGIALDDPEAFKETVHIERSTMRMQWKWVFASMGILAVLQTPPVLLLPMASWSDLVIALVAWFVGGALVGYVSPGKTLIEPAIAALATGLVIVAFLALRTPAAGTRLVFYVLDVAGGAVAALLGAFLGEILQARSERR